MSEAPPERDPDADLNPSERLVMRALRGHEHGLPKADAVAEAGLPENTARDAMSRLVEKGRAERRRIPTDGRERRWILTEYTDTASVYR